MLASGFRCEHNSQRWMDKLTFKLVTIIGNSTPVSNLFLVNDLTFVSNFFFVILVNYLWIS